MARLLFFGKLGDLAGGRMRELALAPGVATVSALVEQIAQGDAALGGALTNGAVRYIINESMASGQSTIANADEIAFLPPVSGG